MDILSEDGWGGAVDGGLVQQAVMYVKLVIPDAYFFVQKQLQLQEQKQINEEHCFLKGNNSTTQDCLQNERENNLSRKHDRWV